MVRATIDRTLSDKAFVSGVGQTEFGRRGSIRNRSEFQLLCEAIVAAAEDAGIDVSEIDGFVSFAGEVHEPAKVAYALGIPGFRFSNQNWGGGGGGPCGAIMNAALAIHGGVCKNVVVYRALCQVENNRYGQFRERPHSSYLAPFGFMSPAQSAALLFRRHMHVYGTKAEALGHVGVTFRAHAMRNPHALFHGRPLTLEDYEASRMIAEPFRLFDLCLETDGACAIIVTSPERARDGKQKPVRILAAAQAADPGWGMGPIDGYNVDLDSLPHGNALHVAEAVFGMAGVKPSDIDVAQIYDGFSGSVIRSLGDYGFCKHDEVSDFVMDGNLRYGSGKLPCNTAGGQLSEGYLMGLNLCVEAIRQVRGASTAQVDNVQTSFVNSGGGNSHSSAAIFAA